MNDTSHPCELAYRKGTELAQAHPLLSAHEVGNLAKLYENSESFVAGYYEHAAQEGDTK